MCFYSYSELDNAPSNSDILEQFKELILDARTCRHWDNEYHLYALCIALKRPFYIYSTFKLNGRFNHELCTTQELQMFFTQNLHSIGRHLQYVPDSQLIPYTQIEHPIFGFYQFSHYTAVLPKKTYLQFLYLVTRFYQDEQRQLSFIHLLNEHIIKK